LEAWCDSSFLMDRFVLTDAQWAKMEPHCSGKPSDPGLVAGGNNRLFVEAVLWIARTGSPWRDLPKQFGKWNSVFVRLPRLGQSRVFSSVFSTAASDEPDMEYAMVDATIVKVHRHGTGRKRGTQKSGDRQVQGAVWTTQNPRSGSMRWAIWFTSSLLPGQRF